MRLAKHWMLAAATIMVVSALSLTLIEDPLLARDLIMTGACLALWLGEAVPPYAPTLLLFARMPSILARAQKSLTLWP